MKKYILSIVLSFSITVNSFGLHLVSDAAAQALQSEQIVKTAALIQSGLEQYQALLSVINQVKEVYNVIGYYRDTISDVSNLWSEIQNQWTFDEFTNFDDFMTSSSDRLGRWGIQPAQSGILGDLVTKSKKLKEEAQMSAGSLANLPYDYSRDNVLNDLFTTTTVDTSKSKGFLDLFSTDVFQITEKEDPTFEKTENGVMVKTASGELATPTEADKLLMVDKLTENLEDKFQDYAKKQAAFDAQTKAMAKEIISDSQDKYGDNLVGIAQQSADLAALQVASISDVTSAINQNTATNVKMNQLMLEVNKAKTASEEAANFKNLLND